MCAQYPEKPEEDFKSLETGATKQFGDIIRVLRIKHGLSRSTASVFNHWAISAAPVIYIQLTDTSKNIWRPIDNGKSRYWERHSRISLLHPHGDCDHTCPHIHLRYYPLFFSFNIKKYHIIRRRKTNKLIDKRWHFIRKYPTTHGQINN